MDVVILLEEDRLSVITSIIDVIALMRFEGGVSIRHTFLWNYPKTYRTGGEISIDAIGNQLLHLDPTHRHRDSLKEVLMNPDVCAPRYFFFLFFRSTRSTINRIPSSTSAGSCLLITLDCFFIASEKPPVATTVG